MNNFGPGILKWVSSKLSKTVVMLYLTIHINDTGQIQHRTYQKELNVYAYVPQSSSHPPGMLRGLVLSQIAQYWKQNSCCKDFKKYTTLLY